jgi:hypothetical protein
MTGVLADAVRSPAGSNDADAMSRDTDTHDRPEGKSMTKKMSKSLEEIIKEETAAIEAAEADQTDRPLPPHVKVTYGNPNAKVLQVRLNPEELEALDRIAERRELPVSTIAREQLLKLIAGDQGIE